MDPDRRLTDMSGNILSDDVEEDPADNMDSDSSLNQQPEDNNDQYNGIDFSGSNASSTVTLDIGLRFGPLGKTTFIRNIMDITTFPSCYMYV